MGREEIRMLRIAVPSFFGDLSKIRRNFLSPAQNVEPAKICVVLIGEMLYTFYIRTFDIRQFLITASAVFQYQIRSGMKQ